MKIISHRGNLKGPEPETENSPKKIEEALKLGYDCEVDVWYQSGVFTLCHDFKNNKHYNVNVQFLKKNGLWCHAKNIEAISALQKIDVNFFWHEDDKLTLTSKGWVWCHPTCQVSSDRSIICLPELHNIDVKFFDGLCTDYTGRYINKVKNAKD
jgi:hypothetical protein